MDEEAGTGPLRWEPAEGPPAPEAAGRWTHGAGPAAAPRQRRRRRRRIAFWVTFGLLCAAYLGLQTASALMFKAVSVSPGDPTMEPGIQPGDRVVYQPGAGGLERGDVVVLRLPGVGATTKRVIGLPGDRVACCDSAGRVTVDGKALNEGYLTAGYAPSPAEQFSVTVGAGEVWVMGDNRAISRDSREWGPLPEGDIAGLVVLVFHGGRPSTVTTPSAFTAAGFPSASRPVILLLGGLSVLVFAAIVVMGAAGLIAWAVRRHRRRRQIPAH